MSLKRKHPMKVLETAMKKHDPVLRRLGNKKSDETMKRKCPSCGSLHTIDNYTKNDYMKCLDCGYVDFWKPRWKLVKEKNKQ